MKNEEWEDVKEKEENDEDGIDEREADDFEI